MFRNYKPDKCYIIAEIGGNFTTFDEAKILIDAAADCVVDAVKLQTFKASTLSSKKAVFDMENTGVTSQFDLFLKYQIDEKLHRDIFEYAEAKNLDWFSTPSHETDVDLLDKLGVGAHKIGSDDAVNIPFLRYVARTGKPVILSTGMCTLDEVKESIAAIKEEGVKQLMILHAITSYPTHPENVNLLAMKTLMQEFPDLDIGYSDHTLDPTACICAAAMGARILEKHFTHDKNAEGPDHVLSADPVEMKALVDAVRKFETMKGDGVKKPAESEKTTRLNNRKSIVLNRDLAAGGALTEDCLSIKRPGLGIPPKHFEEIIGRTVARDLEQDDVLQWEDLN